MTSFSPGQFVRIRTGHYANMTGTVLGEWGGMYRVLLTSTEQEIRLYAYEMRVIQRTTEIAAQRGRAS